MAEIVWPSELEQPYSLDLTNQLTVDLLSANVGIFISDDNLATVTNVVDGSAGTATDITSNELGEVLGGYRVGVDISSLSAQEQAELQTNPYQLLQTQEDVSEEYALNWGNATGQGLQIPAEGTTGGITVELTLSKDMQEIFSGNNSSRALIDFGSSRKVTANMLSQVFYAHPSHVTTYLNDVDISADLTPLETALKDDVIKMVTASGSNDAVIIGAYISGHVINTSSSSFGYLGLSKVLITDDIGTRLYSFNTTQGYTFPDLYGSVNDAVGVNFLPDNGSLQPVIENQVFDINGGSNDYSTAYNYEAGEVNTDAHKIGYVYGDTGETADISIVDQLGTFELRAALGQEFDLVTLTGARIGTARLRTARCTNIIRDLIINRVEGGIANNTANDLIERCFFDGSGDTTNIAIVLNNNTDYQLLIKNSVMIGFNDGTYIPSSTLKTNLKIRDSLFLSQNRYGVNRGELYNCLFYNSGSKSTNDTIENYCISDDSFLVGTNSLINQPVSTWFTDATNNDYTINQTGQDALSGQGWNGSDIVSFAYADEVTSGVEEYTVHCTFNVSVGIDSGNLTKESDISAQMGVSADQSESVVKDSSVSAEFGTTSDQAISGLKEASVETSLGVDSDVNISGLKESSVSTQIGSTLRFRSSITKEVDQTVEFDVGTEFDQGLDLGISVTKGSYVSTSFDVQSDYDNSLTKSAIQGTQFSMGVDDQFKLPKSTSHNLHFGFETYSNSSILKVSNYNVSFDISKSVDSSIVKTSSVEAYFNSSLEFSSSNIKSSNITATFEESLDLTSSILKLAEISAEFDTSLNFEGEVFAGEVDLYSYTLQVNGVIFEQNFKGSYKYQEFNGVVHEQIFNGRLP